MKKIQIFLLLGFLTQLSVTSLQAASVDITYLGGGGSNYSTQFENLLNPKLEDVDTEKFNLYLSNAAGIADRGLGTDYADTNFKWVNIGFIGGVGVAPTSGLSKLMQGDFDVMALSPALAVSIGLDMHYVPVPILKNFKFFFNFFTIDAGKWLGENISKAKNLAWGIHVLYPVVKSVDVKSANLLRWGGINVSGGIDYISNNIDFTFPLTQSGVKLTPKLELTSWVFTIPLEVSTNVRLLYLLTLFAGFGTDFNFGSSQLKVGSSSFTATDGGKYELNVDLGKKRSPHFMTLRVFAGLQVNIWAFHIYTKVNYAFTSKALAMQAGFRFSY